MEADFIFLSLDRDIESLLLFRRMKPIATHVALEFRGRGCLGNITLEFDALNDCGYIRTHIKLMYHLVVKNDMVVIFWI